MRREPGARQRHRAGREGHEPGLSCGISVPLVFQWRCHLGKAHKVSALHSATQSPDFPPCLSSTLISPITMPRSAALHMS